MGCWFSPIIPQHTHRPTQINQYWGSGGREGTMYFLSSPPGRLMEIINGLNSHRGCLEDVNMLTAVELCFLCFLQVWQPFEMGSNTLRSCQYSYTVSLTLLSTQLKGGRINDTTTDWLAFSKLKEMLLGAITETVFLRQCTLTYWIKLNLVLSGALEWSGVLRHTHTHFHKRCRLTASVVYRRLFPFKSPRSRCCVDPVQATRCFDHAELKYC